MRRGWGLFLSGGHLEPWGPVFNTLRPRQNGRHFPDDTFKRILVNENVWISLKISLKFVPKGPSSNSPALFQIMAWRRPGDKPLSEAMLISLLTHKCVTRPQWVKLVMATNRDVWISPSLQIWSYVLHVKQISCAIMNCGQHQRVIPSVSIALHYQKITIPILQNFAFPGCFTNILYYNYLFS